MKAAAVIIVAVALAFVLYDIIAKTIDLYTFLVAAACIAVTVWLVAIENRVQKS